MHNYQIDPITLEVIRNRFDNIADEMEMTLLKSAFSSIIKEVLDASAAIFDRQGKTLAQAASVPCQLGMLMEAVSQIKYSYPEEEMHEGDIFIMNDPYKGGTHLPDITIVMPVYYKGKLAAFSGSLGHHQDVGGKTPGSTPPDATEIYAEGLRIPPMKLYERGEPNETLIGLIKANVRMPEISMGDIRAQIACANVGSKRILAIIDEYGLETMNDTINALMDHSEKLTRKCIEEMPDGIYSFYDYIDDDGIDLGNPIKISVTITIKGSNIHFDFMGSNTQVKGPINCVPASTKSAIYYIIRALTDPTIPNNDGCYRSITMNLPLGSIVNAKLPGACGCRTICFKRLVDVLMGALVKAIPDKVHAASNGQLTAIVIGGYDVKTEKAYVSLSGVPTAGGMGARPTKDGIDVIDTDLSNLMNQPVEANEIDFPIRMSKIRLWTDSGGAGKFRGGLGYESEFEITGSDVVVSHRRDRHDFAPWGIFGGKAAPTCKTIIYRREGGEENIPSKLMTYMKTGDRMRVLTTGGGGYGDPLERDPEKVLEDVIENRVSPKAAYEIYGVVLNKEQSAINLLETEARRKKLAEQNKSLKTIFDRGKGFEEKTGHSSKHG